MTSDSQEITIANEIEEESRPPSKYSKDYLTDEELRCIFETKCQDSKTKFSDQLLQRFIKHYRRRECSKIFSFQSAGIGPQCSYVIYKIFMSHSNFRVLNLSGNAIGRDGTKYIAHLILQSPFLISIDVSSCSLDGESCASLFNALAYNNSVVYFNISSVSGVTRNSFGESSIEHLKLMFEGNHILSELNISQTEIPPFSVQLIAHGLEKNKTLEILNISNNNFRSAGAVHIINALKRTHLKELIFSNNHIKDDVAPHFSNYIQGNKYLKKLDISSNDFTHKFINSFAESLINNQVLEEINISKNAITGRAMATLGTALASNNYIRKVNIAGCQIDANGFNEFCVRFAKNTNVEVFIAHNNPIQDKGMETFAHVIENHTSLREIDFEFCEMTDTVTKPLFEAIGKSKISKVNIKNNLIHDGEAVQRAIGMNKDLISINFDYNDIDYKTSNDINRLLTNNIKMIKEQRENNYQKVVIDLRNTLNELHDSREKIIEERRYGKLLDEQLADATKQNNEKSESRAKNVAELTNKLAQVTNELQKFVDDSRMNQDLMQTESANIEVSVQKLEQQFKTETDTFKTVSKALSELEARIDGANTQCNMDLQLLKMTKEDLKKRYLDAQFKIQERFKELHPQAMKASISTRPSRSRISQNDKK
ncbi:Leucine Rich Repeat family protein [Trichomonas vaginalis G3]|uniref:Leucine Rich Repeat family protein n=1 Tax=Trichomonas vaginalis (strain ATCC PRA-98 / G3) TaxID=412133 RepID=A2FU90_TRIV3|nr:uncharacterized protein TVAGG3_0448040 [Trichomonas vaginalis G3]EAX91521.1 Leucine Rich Repeat family protein [Trichomonas vaginalis G3]KAI5537951.1 interleukin-8 biosynthetic process [Trichomonas vaginalis G3]|eukprot:XP_001304451.1 hypothetical protein [Trichomonas vaginalis G3]